MRIPDRFMLLGREWSVMFDPEMPADADGVCDRVNRIIRLRPGLSEEYTLETFLHETDHAWWPPEVVSERAENIIISAGDAARVDVVRALVEG